MTNKIKLLVIPGLPRCATTAFVNVLNQHPDVVRPLIKEPHYFIPDEDKKKLYSFNKGVSKYFEKLGFCNTWDDFSRSNREFQKEGLYIDASTLYSVHVSSIFVLKETNLFDPYFIIMNRDPFDRAFSHYKFSLSRGEEFRSFSKALEDERDGKYADWLLGGYVKGSKVGPIKKEVIRCFSESKLMEVDLRESDIFTKDFFRKVCCFLGLQDYEFNFDVYENASGVIENPILNKFRIFFRSLRQHNPYIFDNKITRYFFERFMKFSVSKDVLKPTDEDRILYMELYDER